MNTHFYPPKKMAKKENNKHTIIKFRRYFLLFCRISFISKSVTTTACLRPGTKQKHRGDETGKRVYSLHHKIRHLASNPAVNISGNWEIWHASKHANKFSSFIYAPVDRRPFPPNQFYP